MKKIMKCTHRETAIMAYEVDGLCAYCLQDRIKELEAENDSIKKWLNDKLEDYDFSDFIKDIEKSVLRIKKVKSERDKLKQAIGKIALYHSELNRDDYDNPYEVRRTMDAIHVELKALKGE